MPLPCFSGEHIGPRRWAGLVLGLAGVGLLHGVWRADFQWAGLAASLIFLSSLLCEAAYSILGKTVIARASVMKTLALSLLIATAVNVLVDGRTTMQAAESLSGDAWVLLLALAAVCTCLGYTVWLVVIRECPVNLAALTVFAQSVCGVLLAWAWVGERLHWGQLLGCGAIVVGLVWGLSRQVGATGGRKAPENEACAAKI